MAEIGTLAWARKTGGRIGVLDRLKLARQALEARALRTKRAGQAFPRLDFDSADLVLPDSAAAMRAISVAEELSAPFLLNHCLRTFCWGALLAKSVKMACDRELLFVSSVLHDLGLSERHQSGVEGEHCFAVTGGRLARGVMQGAGWEARRLDALEEAIQLHLNIVVSADHGAEAHLLHAGASLDMIGIRREEVGDPPVAAVLARFPRGDHKAGMAAVLDVQCRARPQSRIAFLMGQGFDQMIQNAPFGD